MMSMPRVTPTNTSRTGAETILETPTQREYSLLTGRGEKTGKGDAEFDVRIVLTGDMKNPESPHGHLQRQPQIAGKCCLRREWLRGQERCLLQRALAAQNPTKESWSAISKLTEEDRYWLEREETQRWDLPRGIYYTITLCSLGSAIQG